MLSGLAAPVFVLLWSTGFIVARAITPYVDPNLYLFARFSGTSILFCAVALSMRARWPKGREALRHVFAGALLQGVYLGAGYWAVAQGLGAGIMALLGALQPLLTAAIAARLFGERLSRRAWCGLALGLIGVALVLAPKIAANGAHAAPHGTLPPWLVVMAGVLAIVAITAGDDVARARVGRRHVVGRRDDAAGLDGPARRRLARHRADVPRAAARGAGKLRRVRRDAGHRATVGVRVSAGRRAARTEEVSAAPAVQSTVSAPAGVFARAAAPGPGDHAGRVLRAVSTTTR
jgi:uncharacterized membrane protein